MSRSAYSDTDEFSDQGINPDFHVVPSSSQYDPSEQDYEHRHDKEDDEEDDTQKALLPTEQSTEEESLPIEWHPVVIMAANVLKKVLTPALKIVFAPQTQRAIIKSLVVVIVVAWIILTSFTAYLTFYQRYIPKTAHVEPIYFQYSNNALPEGQVQFRGPNPIMPLRSEQAYDVSIQLHVPTSDINFNLGNFMVHVDLLTQNGTIIAQSSRPAILRYQSVTQRVLHVLAKALPLLMGWTEESQHISVVLIENHIERKMNPITQARVTLGSSQLQIYDAYISAVADFRGLRYYMYHRRIATAFVFIALFTAIEVVFASVAWSVFGKNLWDKLNEIFSTDEIASEEEQEAIREGEEEEQAHLDDEDDYLSED